VEERLLGGTAEMHAMGKRLGTEHMAGIAANGLFIAAAVPSSNDWMPHAHQELGKAMLEPRLDAARRRR
jgi:hypothetical protein